MASVPRVISLNTTNKDEVPTPKKTAPFHEHFQGEGVWRFEGLEFII